MQQDYSTPTNSQTANGAGALLSSPPRIRAVCLADVAAKEPRPHTSCQGLDGKPLPKKMLEKLPAIMGTFDPREGDLSQQLTHDATLMLHLGRSIEFIHEEMSRTIRGSYDSALDDDDLWDIVFAAAEEVDCATDAVNRECMSTDPDPTDSSFSATELLGMVLPPTKWVIRGILPEGLSLLAGKPKMGKSWLALAIGMAAANAGVVLGSIPVDGGDVLYLALEDNPRRLQERLRKLLNQDSAGDGLEKLRLLTECRRLDKGGLETLEAWLQSHSNARLIIIDTLARIRPRHTGKNSGYQEDYGDMTDLHALAATHGVAILVITHLRKALADDPLDAVNATTGLTGVVDATLILRRERGRHDATLYVTGRDVREQELALKWNADLASWSLLGNADDYRQSSERQDVINAIGNAGRPLSPRDVSDALGKNYNACKKLLWTMSNEGQLIPDHGRYFVKVGNPGNPGNLSDPGN
jgi:hypothetical protein